MDEFYRQYLHEISTRVTDQSGIGLYIVMAIAILFAIGMITVVVNDQSLDGDGRNEIIAFLIGLIMVITSIVLIFAYIGPISEHLNKQAQTKAVEYTKKHPDDYKYKIDMGDKNLKMLWSKPTEVYKTKSVKLVSTNTQNTNDIEGSIHGSYLLASGSVDGSVKTEDKTDYRYYVDLGDGKSQLRKLSDEYPDAEAKDIYIQELDHVDQPQLKIEHHRYQGKAVRNALKATNFMYMDEHPIEWITYTFEVPKGSVNNISKLS